MAMQPAAAGAGAGASGSPAQFASLYVGDINQEVTEAMLYEIFNAVGPVASIRVCRDSVSRKSLGYAYVNYHNLADAERALDTLNYSQIKGRACRIMWSQRDPASRKTGNGNIFVKNLDKNIDNKALYDTFSLFGNILSCKVAMDLQGNSKGYGFVHYETEEAAKQAIERVNNMQIGEKCVFVGSFTKNTERDNEPKHFTNLYVRNFPQEWDEAKIKSEFGAHGNITSMCVNQDKNGRKFAFLNFESCEEAKACIEAKHDNDVRTDEEKAAGEEGETNKLYCQRAQTKAERATKLRREMQGKTTGDGVNLYIKNLDESIDDERLKGLFASFGTITSCKVARDERGASKGFGFVCFSNPDEATKAVTEMHLKRVAAKPLYVGLAEKRDQRVARLQQRFRNGPPTAMGMGGGAGGMGGGYGMQKGMQKQMLGEKLFPAISRMFPEMGGKITGMMLEMDNSELLILLESPDQLKAKVEEALRVLEGR